MFLKPFPRYAGRARRGATVAGDNLRGTAVVVENAREAKILMRLPDGRNVAARGRWRFAAILGYLPDSVLDFGYNLPRCHRSRDDREGPNPTSHRS